MDALYMLYNKIRISQESYKTRFERRLSIHHWTSDHVGLCSSRIKPRKRDSFRVPFAEAAVIRRLLR